ncbi:hypothetical protein [Clostridium lundense]|uniref:hypothetical protein n=1 Tax=Clostridium lundense TaxID=319475 RepID=UPI00048828EB|nr:hypothetical protein [Clostridium lundense]
MSLGFEGYARYKEESNGYLIYEYSGANWNLPNEEEDRFLYDGLISIKKSVLNEEEWGKAVDEGRIKIIKECKNAFYIYEMKFDYLAIHIIYHIYVDYKKIGKLPQEISFIQ